MGIYTKKKSNRNSNKIKKKRFLLQLMHNFYSNRPKITHKLLKQKQ